MASSASDEAQVAQKLSELTTSTKTSENQPDTFQPHLSGFDTRELYRLALSFYKEKEGKAVHLSYEDKLKLVAFTQQVSHGQFSPEKSPELGVLDVIGRDRKVAWQSLGDISKEQAMEGFIVLLDKLCPLFRTFVEAQKHALNQQTYYQFKSYAEQQYPGNPEQQGVLIRQLQEQHYHQYMQQLQRSQSVIEDNELEKKDSICELPKKEPEKDPLIPNDGSAENDEDSDEQEDWPKIVPAEMWTNKNIDEFKETIRKETGDAVIKVGHGETVTVRVPTHEDGSCLFWEFATDGYDIGFGVYFEWSKPSSTQVSVHISESEDDDEDEEDYETKEDLECGDSTDEPKTDFKPSTTPISVIVPVYRRDSQEEVYAGSHQYPGQGVYLLKFDNSYSLWRSKTLYYRVYYTRPSAKQKK
ncbi:hypothetical protein QAD02_022888 [Eretmocerus hayati]|uniref:Uncharacterized protein n=1 Tax=Eretmocerus hayati TaxID=131215 RepID=A0ACC2PWR8_9HYME|nr:hypothetical protein QAD02_022888 [Eretmocerus hayati]